MTKPATGMGQSQRVIGASCHTAKRKSPSDTAQNSATWTTDSWPLGSSRPAVRGLRASSRASISRLSAIASDRAPTIATVIQTRSCPLGHAFTARNAPTYANGSAKTVCSIFTSRAKRVGSGAIAGADAVTGRMLSRLAVRDVSLARQQLERMREGGTEHLEAVAAAAG